MEDIKRHLLKNIEKNMALENPSTNDLFRILSDIRSFLEEDKTHDSQFQTLLFYCNWAVHPKIERNNGLNRILEKLNIGLQETLFEDPANKYDSHKDTLAEALEINRLQFEFQSFIAIFLQNQFEITNELIIEIFRLILFRRISYSNSQKHQQQKQQLIDKANQISQKINKKEKYSNKKLDPFVDYSNPMIFIGIKVIEINNNVVLFELIPISPTQQRILYELEFKNSNS